MATALITGAGRGIGLATARAFLGAGWRVLALDREFDAGGPAPSDTLVQVRYDLSELAGISALVASLGRIDVLVNNAGMQNAVPYDRYTDAMRERILRVNLEAPVELMRAVAKQMLERHAGRIVNLASIAAWQPHPDLWYGATKAAIVSVTKSFASYLGPHGIQVNAVAPGPVDTELLKVVDRARVEGLLKAVYTGRPARPDEIAQAILWLASASPPTVNGTILDINDGTYPRS
ncbi:MAG: SDR family NAD(P)-dependent oxidoreductase [Burkholderiales bacterium]